MTVRDGVVTMAAKRLGFSEAVETPLEFIHPKATHIRQSEPKLFFFGIAFLALALVMIVLALLIANFDVGGPFVLLGIVIGVFGEQMLETYFSTRKDEIVFYNMMTGGVAVILRRDKPNQQIFQEFLDGFMRHLPKPDAAPTLKSEEGAIVDLRIAKQMLDEGLITGDDYERRKEIILGLYPGVQPRVH